MFLYCGSFVSHALHAYDVSNGGAGGGDYGSRHGEGLADHLHSAHLRSREQAAADIRDEAADVDFAATAGGGGGVGNQNLTYGEAFAQLLQKQLRYRTQDETTLLSPISNALI